MSALDELTAQPYKAAAPAAPALTALTATPHVVAPVTTTAPSLSSLISKPYTPTVAPAAPVAPTSPYYQGKTPTGAFLGISDESDPFSGRPYFAYRTPGATATTTDKTRTASMMNPEVAAPTDKSNFENPRMPESASQAVRAEGGATKDQQLDHRMALAVAGSNDKSNLKLIPTIDNQAASKLEGQLPSEIAGGKVSLFEAQNEEAKAKGLTPPWTDQDVQKAGIFDSITKAPDNSTLGIIKNTILGLPNAAIKVIGNTGQTNEAGLTSLQQVSSKLDSALASLGPQGDGLQKMKAELDATKVDATDPKSVATYNTKVNAFNDELQKFNFKTTQGQKMVDAYGNAVDAYNKSVVAPSGATGFMKGIADGIVQQYTKPSGDEQNLENSITAPEPFKLISIPILRTITPMVEPLLHDAAASMIFNQPELYKDFVQNIQQDGLNPTAADLISTTHKSVPQVVGDTAQAVLSTYFPEVFGDSMVAYSAKGFAPAVLATATHGATAGFAFGVAQAASSGSTDPKELGAIVLQNTVGGALLTLATAGVSHGAIKGIGPVLDAIKERLPKTLAEAQRGFVHIPGLGDLPEEGDITSKGQDDGQEKTKGHTPFDTTSEPQRPAEEEMAPIKDLAENSKTPEEFNASLSPEDTTKVVAAAGTPEHLLPVEHPQEIPPEALKDVPNMPGVKEERGTGALYFKNEKGDLARIDTAGAANDFYTATSKNREPVVKEPVPKNIPAPQDFTQLLEQAKKYDMSLQDFKTKASVFYNVRDPAIRAYLEDIHAGLNDTANRQTQPTHTPTPAEARSGTEERTGQRPTAKPEGKIEEKHPNNTEHQKINPSRETSYSKPQVTDKRGEHTAVHEYNKDITEHNGGIIPPENKGGLQAPEIDWTKVKDKAALRLSTDTMERNIEKTFGDQADKVNKFLMEPTRINETERVRWANEVRKQTKAVVVDKLGIKPGSLENRLIQQFGEGRINLDQLKEKAPNTYEKVVEATMHFRKVYDDALDKWNAERALAGMKPIPKLPNYFRHFVDLGDWVSKFGFNFTQGDLPTAIAGITEFFKSQTPWASAAMRRLGSTFTDDALGGLDNFIDNTSRAIFHTDSVQRGRLLEKYMRKAATQKPNDIKLGNFANNLNDWTNLVSGKQAKLDRAVEAVIGRPALAVMRAISRRFGANVIAGNVSSAVTHAIPLSYTLATVNKGAALQGLLDVLRSPFMESFTHIDGSESGFLTRRFGKEQIVPTLGEKIGGALATPFHLVDQFISRFAVAAKYHEGLQRGLSANEAMKQADNYAVRVIGDRSTGNLPNLMNTKTLGWLTQFQIEVNDNIHVLTHDIPRWEAHDPIKIANRFIQFAVYSFLFNQAMQAIKGSGKGLDPIDMGLTLAGLNDEGHDQTVMDRLKLVGADLMKELPFTSVPTGGQIPALQPIGQAFTDAAAGNYTKSLEGILASFASPVGGGQQLQKTIGGIEAWKQGYVTDSQGHITATIDPTISNLIQGGLFGKNAFAGVKKSKSEITTLDNLIKTGQATGKQKNQQASNIWAELKGMPADQAKTQLSQIAAQDPDMAKRVLTYAKQNAAGETKQDLLVKSLGVSNGARAAYVVSQLKGMQTNDEKKQYLSDLAQKKILTADVLSQVVQLMK